MRARTISQIADIDRWAHGRHDGCAARTPASAVPAEPAPAEEVDVEALSNEDIDRLLDGQAGCSMAVLRSTEAAVRDVGT